MEELCKASSSSSGRTVLLINSHNSSRAASLLLARLVNFNLEDTLLVIGGAGVTSLSRVGGTWTLRVLHNSIDFTALIAVVEHDQLVRNSLGDIWSYFYVHDTVVLGPQFSKRLKRFGDSTSRRLRLWESSILWQCGPAEMQKYRHATSTDPHSSSVPLLYGPSMNIGLYLRQDLLHRRCTARLRGLRSSDAPSKEELVLLKAKGQSREDDLFNFGVTNGSNIGLHLAFAHSPQAVDQSLRQRVPWIDSLLTERGVDSSAGAIYGGRRRVAEYFEPLDLLKFKANSCRPGAPGCSLNAFELDS